MKNLMGYRVFISDLRALQQLDADTDMPNVTTRLLRPVSRSRRYILKLLDSWFLIVGISFGLLTVKVLVESVVGHMR